MNLQNKYREFISEHYTTDNDAPSFEEWKEDNVTDVLFLIDKPADEFTGKDEVDALGVYAYFPDNEANSHGCNVCYSLIGQHSACHPDYANECEQATPEQYKDLKEELEGIGYVLNILNVIKI